MGNYNLILVLHPSLLLEFKSFTVDGQEDGQTSLSTLPLH